MTSGTLVHEGRRFRTCANGTTQVEEEEQQPSLKTSQFSFCPLVVIVCLSVHLSVSFYFSLKSRVDWPCFDSECIIHFTVFVSLPLSATGHYIQYCTPYLSIISSIPNLLTSVIPTVPLKACQKIRRVPQWHPAELETELGDGERMEHPAAMEGHSWKR